MNGEHRKDPEMRKDVIASEYHLAVSVDCVIFGYDEEGLKVLLIKSDTPEYEGKLSLPGDLVHPTENLKNAASRVLEYRTGLMDVYMEQVMAFSEVGRHPAGRVITIAYYSLVEIDEYAAQKHSKMDAEWYDVKTIKELAFDHKAILDNCLTRLKLRLREKPIGFELLPEKFTLKQTQHLYEVVLDIKLDKRNFRRKLKSLNVLEDCGERQKAVNHRPARLYHFNMEKYDKKKKKGMFMNF